VFLDLQVAGSNPGDTTFSKRNNIEQAIHSHLLRPTKSFIPSGSVNTSFAWVLKSLVGLRQQGAWMHHETYAAESECVEFTLARGRRMRSYFAKCHTYMFVCVYVEVARPIEKRKL